ETTQFLLDHFGLLNLDELPNVEELRTRRLPKARPVAGVGDAGSPELPTPATPPEGRGDGPQSPVMRVVMFAPGGSGEPPLPFLGRLIGNRCASPIFALLLLTSASAVAEILPADCARAAKYSESKRGVSMLVMQNGQTIFEHYANGGSARGRWPIFSGTKSFWGVAALAAMRDGLFKLDDPVSDTITEWKSDSRKSQITIRKLLNQTDGIEGASRLQRASIRDRNAMAIRLPAVAEPGSAFIYGPSHLQIFSELLRRKLRGRSTTGYFEGRVSNRLGLGRL